MKRFLLLCALMCTLSLSYGQGLQSQLRFDDDQTIELENTKVLSTHEDVLIFVNGVPTRLGTQLTSYISEIKGQDGWAITTVGEKTRVIGATPRGNFESYTDPQTLDQKMYYPNEVLERPVRFCDALEIPETELPQPRREPEISPQQLDEVCVQLDVQADYSLYENYASLDEAIEEILGTYDVVSYMYQQEDINLVVSSLTIYDNPSSDPFANINNSYDGLYTVGDYAVQYGINGDLIQLISDNGSGGVAWVSGLGNANPYYRSSFASIYSNYAEFPTYTWDVEVITHELGHNLSSRHTHGCYWGENNDQQIDDCGNVAGYVEGTNCYDSANPILPTVEGGTFMSYCHLVGSVGINFLNGAGQEPGDRMRNRVANYASACNTSCLSPFDFFVVGVTATTATVNWTAIDGFTYELIINGQIYNPVSPPFTIEGLSPTTVYTASLITNCSDGEASYPANRTFETGCASPFGLPYTANFNTGDDGWTSLVVNNHPNDQMVIHTYQPADASQYSPDGGRFWETNPGVTGYGLNAVGYIQSPCVSFAGAVSPTLRVEVAWSLEAQWDGVKAQYTTDNITWNDLGTIASWSANGYTYEEVYALQQTPGWSGNNNALSSEDWVEAVHSLDFLVGEESVRFRFVIGSDVIFSLGFGFRMDNFRIVVEGEPCVGEDVTIFTGSCDIAETDTTYQTLLDENGCTYTQTTIIEAWPTDVVLVDAPTCNINQDGITVTTTTQNEYGCDSTTVTSYYYVGSPDEEYFLESCNEDEAGVVVETLTNEEGCEYTVTTTTEWIGSPDEYYASSTCVLGEAGVVQETLTNENGCEYLVTTETVYEGQEDVEINETTCFQDEAGTVTVTLTNEAGCEYDETTVTTYVGQDDETVTILTCNEDEVGTVTELVTNEAGCEYLVTTITELDTDCPTEDCTTLSVDIGDCVTIFRGLSNFRCVDFVADVTGGTPPYTYEWVHVVGEGIFEVELPQDDTGAESSACYRTNSVVTVTVTDANGCVVTDDAMVEYVDLRCSNGNSYLTICLNGVTECVKRSDAIALVNSGQATWSSCDYIPCSTGGRVSDQGQEPVNITVYPNPTTGVIKYEYSWDDYPSLMVEVMTVDGKVVGTWDNKFWPLDQSIIDLSGKQNGIYLLNFFNINNSNVMEYIGTTKVVLQK